MLDRSKQPEITGFSHLNYVEPEVQLLPNGIKLLVAKYDEAEINTLDVFFTGGRIHEEKLLESQAMVNLLKCGNAEMTSEQVAEFFDYNGAYSSTAVWNNHVSLKLVSLNKNFDEVLPVFFKCIAQPLFPEDDFEVLRGKLSSNFSVSRRTVSYQAMTKIKQMSYGNDSKLAANVQQHHIDALTIADLQRFHSQHIIPENCTLLITGKITDAERDAVASTFGAWHVENATKTPLLWQVNPTGEKETFVENDDAVQSAVVMAINVVPRQHKDYLKLRILTTLLGGYMGSRLMKNIREDKGYTYGISASLVGNNHEGRIIIHSDCDNSYRDDVVREIRVELNRLKTELVSEAELDVVRTTMLADLAKTFETPFEMASYVTSMIVSDVYDEYFNNQVQEIQTITPAELQRIANSYFSEENITLAIAGKKFG